MALSSKIAFNTAIQVITKVIGTLLSLAALALITRYLGSYGFGYYTTAITFVTFFSIAADLGLTLVTTQLISRPGANQNKLLSNLFTFRVVTAAAILVLAPIAAVFSPYDILIRQGIAISSIAFFFILLNQIFTSLFQKELRADKMAYAEIISRVVMFVMTAVAALFDWGLSGILWAMAIANVVSFLLHYYYSRIHASIKMAFDKAIWKEILQLSWPFMLTIVLNLVYLKTDILLLSFLKSPVDVGLYGASYKVIDVLVTIPFMLGGTVLPILSKRWQAKQHVEYQRAWTKIFNATSVLVWPIVVGGFVLASPIMVLIAGEDFAKSGDILKVLIFAVGGVFFSALFSYTMISFGEQRRLIGAYLFTAISSLILYFILIPRFSYIGAAWVTVYSEVIMCLFAWFLVRRYSKLKTNFIVFLKSFGAAIIMGLVVYYLPIETVSAFGLSLAVFIGMIVYGLIAWFGRAVSKAELKELLNWRN
ncbi:MAG: flippase [Candidatus Falkowbacteria bacterium]|nr:flippase [Candidatus Falkowbacteria bacterium]